MRLINGYHDHHAAPAPVTLNNVLKRLPLNGHTPAHTAIGEENAKAGSYRVVWPCPRAGTCSCGGRYQASAADLHSGASHLSSKPRSRLDWGISPLGWQRLRLAGGSVGSAATRPCEMGCSPIHAPP